MAKKRNGMTEKEAGKLGYLASKEKREKERIKRVEEYNKNPLRCQVCGKPIPYKDKSWKKFCSSSCAAKYNNLRRDKEVYIKQSKTIRENLGTYDGNDFSSHKYHTDKKKISTNTDKKKIKTNTNKKKICTICGSLKGECEHFEICKKHQLLKSLTRFGLDYSKKGTKEIYDEYYKIKKQLEDDYKNHISDKELSEKYGYTSGLANFHKILKSLGIKTRTLREGVKESYFFHPYSITSNRNPKYVEGWHKSWDGKDFYLRSSYEFDFARELDKNKIPYKVEELRIKYFDSVKNDYRCAIPDFYLPNTNEIVEIKSTWTLDLQNMKDKFREYERLGYTPKLILEHKETDIYKL